MKTIALNYQHTTFKSDLATPIINVFAKQKLRSRIVVPSMLGYELIKIENIMYVSGSSNYCSLHLTNGKSFTLSKNLSKVCDQLIPNGFIRIHRGYLVNPEYICRIHKATQYEIVLENNVTLPISRSRKTAIMDFILEAF